MAQRGAAQPAINTMLPAAAAAPALPAVHQRRGVHDALSHNDANRPAMTVDGVWEVERRQTVLAIAA